MPAYAEQPFLLICNKNENTIPNKNGEKKRWNVLIALLVPVPCIIVIVLSVTTIWLIMTEFLLRFTSYNFPDFSK